VVLRPIENRAGMLPLAFSLCATLRVHTAKWHKSSGVSMMAATHFPSPLQELLPARHPLEVESAMSPAP
jgi:hypothetical protein